MMNMYTPQQERALQNDGESLDGFQPQKMLQLFQSGSVIKVLQGVLWVNLSSRLLFP